MTAVLRASVYWHDAQGRAWLRDVRLPAGSTLGDAVRASGLEPRLAEAAPDAPDGTAASLRLAVFGRLREAGEALCDGDRVDITRELLVDPKQARRLRAASLRARRRG